MVICENPSTSSGRADAMARIAGIDIPREKRVEIALTYIYGVGLSSSQKILKQTSINPDTRVRDLTEDQVNRLARSSTAASRSRATSGARWR
jgi:ribosomal protein S13